MKIGKLGAPLLVVAVLGTAMIGCAPEDEECEWELEKVVSVAYSRPNPRPAPGPKINTVKPGSKGSSSYVKPGKTPAKMPEVPYKAPKGKHWEWDCD